ncbi:MBL fold metallo-hydrolase [Rhizobium leguminosarum bv. viciae]|nr:MBL fold metallo-hydrolase [Rhizobium leguminosarum bv. viciae]
MSRPEIRVRMYSHLLGDCFLLTIGNPRTARAKRAHILIDCGILQQVPREAAIMKAVAADIARTVEGRLDLVVVTHEHHDHICGFRHGRKALVDEMIIDRLWLAWTEKRGDPQADLLRDKIVKAKDTVYHLAEAAAVAGVNVTANIEHFNGPMSPHTGELEIREIIPSLIARATKTGKVEYLEPGQLRKTPGPVGANTFVLGPSRLAMRLIKSRPTEGPNKETYLAGNFELSLDDRYASAQSLEDALDPSGPTPFSPMYEISPSEVTKDSQNALQWLWKSYLCDDQLWRNIDTAWLGAAGPLALKLDHDTNNTSLVLAFEVEPGGDVLLFAGDAQVGNWLSWHDQTYPSTIPGAPNITATDLLNRTALYKVGHHASHNATLDKLGLSLMIHPGLVAMIPVVEAEARRKKNGKAVHRGWDMPYSELLTNLLTRTKGRVLRGDATPGKNAIGDMVCSDANFLGRVRTTDLYIEYLLP